MEETEVKDSELELARQVIESLAGDFEPSELTSEYRRDLRTLLEVGPAYLRLIRKGIAPVMGEERSETQVWIDIILCGLNDTPGDPSRACDPPNPGQAGDGAQFPEYPEECWDNPELCENRQGG